MAGTRMSLPEAVEQTRTGDLWLFRGRTAADRAIQTLTNAPVNHVGMAVTLDDLPPLMWHAELGRSLPDVWAGTHVRGVQLHVLEDAVLVWGNRYGQRAWLRQLEPSATAAMEDAVLRTIARLDGTPFPSTVGLAGRWARGRGRARVDRVREAGRRTLGRALDRDGVHHGNAPEEHEHPEASLESAYCAEVVAMTYQAMGLLPKGRRPDSYDPGSFWSGDQLVLATGAQLGTEIRVDLPG